MKLSKIVYALVLANIATLGNANEVEEELVEVISVTASRTQRDIKEIASSVTVIDSQEVDKLVATDIRDLVRFEPGVVVEGGGRFGLSGFNIRGINGDRVLILLDGAPVADEFNFGPALSARRDFIDVDMIERVEIIRGPASTLYGSDAIGGVVSFISKDPKQLLQDGQSFGGRVKAGYASVANETVLNAQLAGVTGNIQYLLNATTRDGNEAENFYDDALTGTARNAANPQNNQTDSAQLKVIYDAEKNHRIEFLADYLQGESKTDVQSQVDTRVRGVLITDSQGIDERDRQRLQLNYIYRSPNVAFDKLLTRVYWQQTDNVQTTNDFRLSPPSAQVPEPELVLRTRDSEFHQTVKGVIAQFDKQFTLGDSEHYLIYGSEIQYTDSESIRLGASFSAESGDLIPASPLAPPFPARDFPVSEAREMSFFIQDEIALLEGDLTISPGLRYDEFKLTPFSDSIFESANPGVDVAAFDDSQLSAKLGVVYDISAQTNIWFQFAEGFRIPPFDDLNVGFTNFAGGYTSLANPDLQPESVDSWEIGVRHNGDAVAWSVSAYRNDYDNFIESLATAGFNPVTQLLEFQSRNRDSVIIEGIDAQFTWFLGESFQHLSGWQAQVAMTWLQSEDRATGQSIESILPPQAVLGVGYSDIENGWSVDVIGTFVERFDTQLQPDDPAQALFEAPGYGQVDIIANIEITEKWALNAAVFNLFDREIWNGTETRGLPLSSNNRFFTQAGRNVAINATYQF